MDAIEFSNQIPSDDLVRIFKDFFEQHMLAYDISNGIQFVKINKITMNRSSIIYSVKLLQEEIYPQMKKWLLCLPHWLIFQKVFQKLRKP